MTDQPKPPVPPRVIREVERILYREAKRLYHERIKRESEARKAAPPPPRAPLDIDEGH